MTTKNFVRAESDMQMQAYIDNYQPFGKLHHNREMYDVTKQLTIRPNTDAEREWAYDRESHIGRLDKGLDEAKIRGWTVVDMEKDWIRIFSFDELRKVEAPD